MNYAEIKYYDIANGPGVRVSLFVSGCTHQCKGCFNEIAWDFGYGKPFNDVIRGRIIAACDPYYISGLSILGGEPMEARSQEAILLLLRELRGKLSGKTVWCYSGYTYEELTDKDNKRCHCEFTDELLSLIDVLVDGEFVEEKKDISLRFRGSSNQRIIDLNKTREAGEIVLWED